MLRLIVPSSGDVWHVKLGPGVLGITGIVSLAAIVVVGIATYTLRDDPETLVYIVFIIFGFAGMFVCGSWIFTFRRPDLALLGGAELVKHEELQMAARDKGIVIDQQPIIRGPATTTPEIHDDG